MPHKTGRGTYKGYESPDTGGWPKPIRSEVRRVYGAWRSKHPGESRTIKTRGARIAWSTAKKKYPDLYRRHVRDTRRLATATRKEMREHPWTTRRTAERIARDHFRPSGRYAPLRGRRATTGRPQMHFWAGRNPRTSRKQEPGLISQYLKHRQDARKAEIARRQAETSKGAAPSISSQIKKSSFDPSPEGQQKRERMEQARKESEALRAQGEARFKAEQEAKVNQAALQSERESTVTGE